MGNPSVELKILWASRLFADRASVSRGEILTWCRSVGLTERNSEDVIRGIFKIRRTAPGCATRLKRELETGVVAFKELMLICGATGERIHVDGDDDDVLTYRFFDKSMIHLYYVTKKVSTFDGTAD